MDRPGTESLVHRKLLVKHSNIGELRPRELWEAAKAQQQKGHTFNAALLYRKAATLSDRGPAFQFAIGQLISEDLSKINVPDPIKGEPPYSWRNGQVTYKVEEVGMMAFEGNIYIVLLHEVKPWKTDEEIEAFNRQLIAYFKKQFPEYADTFAGVFARASEEGTGRTHGTVAGL